MDELIEKAINSIASDAITQPFIEFVLRSREYACFK